MAPVSVPPPVGARVTLRMPVWARGLTGTVERHVELTEHAKDRDGHLIGGHSFDVLLDRPHAMIGKTTGKRNEFTHAKWLLQGDAIARNHH